MLTSDACTHPMNPCYLAAGPAPLNVLQLDILVRNPAGCYAEGTDNFGVLVGNPSETRIRLTSHSSRTFGLARDYCVYAR